MSNPRGDVAWCLPNPRTGTFYKRPFAHTTVAQSDLASLLASDGLTFSQAVDAINYDPELRTIMRRFVSQGHGDTLMKEFVR